MVGRVHSALHNSAWDLWRHAGRSRLVNVHVVPPRVRAVAVKWWSGTRRAAYHTYTEEEHVSIVGTALHGASIYCVAVVKFWACYP